MFVLNETAARNLFRKEAVFIGNSDCVPAYRIAELLGSEALDFVRVLNRRAPGAYFNVYCVGKHQFEYVTYKGFLSAVSARNVQLLEPLANAGEADG